MIQVAVALLFADDVTKAIDDVRLRFGTARVRSVVPHVTLVYPFESKASITAIGRRLGEVAKRVPPFTVSLDDFKYFEGERTVAYLAVADKGEVKKLHRLAADAVGDLAEERLAHFEDENFVPHVSIHDEVSTDRLPSLKAELRALRFHKEAQIDHFCVFADQGDAWKIVQTLTLTALG